MFSCATLSQCSHTGLSQGPGYTRSSANSRRISRQSGGRDVILRSTYAYFCLSFCCFFCLVNVFICSRWSFARLASLYWRPDHVFTREGDDGVNRHIQRSGSGLGVQPYERVCIPRGKRQPQCRPVHRGRPAHTQRMVQLLEAHPRTVRPTECSPQALNPDAKSRGTRDNDVRLRHVVPRAPLRHAAPSPPQVLDSLHRLVKAQAHRPSDFLSGHAYQDGK